MSVVFSDVQTPWLLAQFYIKVRCYRVLVGHVDAVGQDGFQIWTVVLGAVVTNKQAWTAEKGGPSTESFGPVLVTLNP